MTDATADLIERETLIEAPPEVVWEVLTDPAHIDRWFTDESELDPVPGGAGTLSWHGHGRSRIQVERAERPRLFSWRWSHSEGEAPDATNSTLVEFKLSEEDGRTRLTVTESGLVEIDWEAERKRAFRADHDEGWRFHMDRISTYAPTVKEPR